MASLALLLVTDRGTGVENLTGYLSSFSNRTAASLMTRQTPSPEADPLYSALVHILKLPDSPVRQAYVRKVSQEPKI